MQNFESSEAKLLYLINEMNKLKMITSIEKALLKQYVLTNDAAVYTLLEKFPTSDTELDLADQLIELIRGPQNENQGPAHEQVIDEDEYQKGQQFNIEAESPLGNQLMKRKRTKPQQQQSTGGLFKLSQA